MKERDGIYTVDSLLRSVLKMVTGMVIVSQKGAGMFDTVHGYYSPSILGLYYDQELIELDEITQRTRECESAAEKCRPGDACPSATRLRNTKMTNVARQVKCAKCYKMNARRCKIQSGRVNINKFNIPPSGGH